MCTKDLVITTFQDKGFSFIYFEEIKEEKEFVFEYPSREDDKWKYTVTYYCPLNELNIVKEHKYSVKPIYYTVFDGVIEKLEDLTTVKKLVLI